MSTKDEYYNQLFVHFTVGLVGDVVISHFKDLCNHHSVLAESELLAREMGSEAFLIMILGVHPSNVLARGKWEATCTLRRTVIDQKLEYVNGQIMGRSDE